MSAGTTTWVELADRAGDGLDVRLFWNSTDGRVKVIVRRTATDQVGELDVAPEDAMDAFYHPFAYRRPAGRTRVALSAAR